MKRRKSCNSTLSATSRITCKAETLAAAVFTAVETEVGREMLSKLESGRCLEIVSASINPMDYSNACTFSRDYLSVEMMSKFPMWELGIDRAGVALQKFLRAEQFIANNWGLYPEASLRVGVKSCTTSAVIHTAARKIGSLLGAFSWNEAMGGSGFGPGATTSRSKRMASLPHKYEGKSLNATPGLEPLVHALYSWIPNWPFSVAYTESSRLVTVPKNAKTDRVICIEPDLNMFFQKGIGRMIRRRLNRVRLLTPTAQEANQALAMEGSANGRLSTIDLSAASDSISLDLVRSLLPVDWVSAIETCRTPKTVLPSGENILLRKVSSMGNGNTFELETLIFWGISSAVIDLLDVRDNRVCVFGDDIIVSSEVARTVCDALKLFGFETNNSKTFTDGPFRESCGKHYFLGADVTPFYVRAPVDSIHRCYWAANSVHRVSRLHYGLDSRFEGVYNLCVSWIPEKFRFRVPESFGDVGLCSSWDEATPRRARNGLDGWEFPYLREKVSMNRHPAQEGALRASLHLMDRSTVSVESGLDSQLSHEPHYKGFRVVKGVSRQWPSYGPWL